MRKKEQRGGWGHSTRRKGRVWEDKKGQMKQGRFSSAFKTERSVIIGGVGRFDIILLGVKKRVSL